ncbi:family 16 glycoside hydrolase [Geomonas subterranea]|uniref:DUF1080 domain-containing protein n=1 Tax=Geomonas subterranea TaxID=2847989 RepID=A0ABX8LRX8_9BACT|nr:MULTISPECIES: family 16 glycoside hydrolase [Geomonas]QXE92265.1 DUF1080 domain-containing protein [Geomonas subterranea]QXM09635.1 DUF1080 domain-containing protein [Geomonas subterranea]
MRRRLLIIPLMVATLVIGCTRSQATVKYPRGQGGAAGQALRWNFDADKVGGVPAGVEVFSGTWEVIKDAGAPSSPNVLCQTGSAQYPALSLSDKVFADFVATARFKPVSGSVDRAAGIIFRIQDKDNYYILRANALEDNVNLYRYSGGSRSLIKEGSARVPSGNWQELRIEVKGETMRGFLNGALVIETRDDDFKAGRVGLWTKADSVTCFDNVEVTAQ